MNNKHLPFLLTVFLFAGCGEENRVAGNGTYIGNGKTSGRIVTASGNPVAGVLVECTPIDFRPGQTRSSQWTTHTDSTGAFQCTDLPTGSVGIFEWLSDSGLGHWREGDVGPSGENRVFVDTLSKLGSLRIALPPATKGILYLTGLSRRLEVDGQTQILLGDMPAGWTGNVKLLRADATSITIASVGSLGPGQTDSVGFDRHHATLRIPLPGGLSEALTDIPLLVRLDSSWHGYSASRADGSDLRLSTTDGADLPLSIADWNPQAKSAALWTRLDTLRVPGDSIDLVLSWGTPVPATAATSAFESSHGWLAAWPLGDTTSLFKERLGSFPGSPTQVTSVAGPIGKASRFDGKSSILVMANSSSSAIVPGQGASFTLTCWARLNRFSTEIGQVAGFGEFGSRLYFKPLQTVDSIDSDTNIWVGRDHRTTPKMGGPYHIAKADTLIWTHLALTVDGDSVRFFVNGARQSRISKFDNFTVGRTPADFAIGGAIDTLGKAKWSFPGDIAEVWMQSVARSAGWIRLVAANQRPDAPKARMLE